VLDGCHGCVTHVTEEGCFESRIVLATDPICGMSVDRSKARLKGLSLEHDGATYYFCGPGCRDKFEVRARGLEPPRAARPNGT
jgi:P-type Cu+ transporter